MTKSMTEQLRINKYLSSIGFCSRREADRLLEQGKVKIDGETAQVGQRVMPEQEVTVNGIPVKDKPREIIIAFNKPKGIVCTSSKKEKNNIVDYLHFPTRIYPVGRLDKDSTGLILLTNDGDLVNQCLRVENGHEKEYVVRVDRVITDEFISKMSKGVRIFNPVNESWVTTLPCKIRKVNDHVFNIILMQGYNRQIRRMCQVFDYKVVDLKRIRFMHLRLDVKQGQYRLLDEKDIAKLKGK